MPLVKPIAWFWANALPEVKTAMSPANSRVRLAMVDIFILWFSYPVWWINSLISREASLDSDVSLGELFGRPLAVLIFPIPLLTLGDPVHRRRDPFVSCLRALC